MVEKVRDYCQYHVLKGTQKYLNHNNIHSQSEIVESQQYTVHTQHSQSKPQDDIAHVELKSVSGGATIFTKSIFVRFNDLDLR